MLRKKDGVELEEFKNTDLNMEQEINFYIKQQVIKLNQ